MANPSGVTTLTEVFAMGTSVELIHILAALGGFTGLQLAVLVILGLLLMRRIDSVKTDLEAKITSVKTDVALLESKVESVRTELKKDIDSVRTEQKNDMASLRTEFKNDMASLRTELKNDIASLRTELKNDIDSLRTEQKNDMEMLKANDLAHLKNFDKAIVFLLSKNKDLDPKDIAYVESLTADGK
jgi:DNA anti-recombination protein RmuC